MNIKSRLLVGVTIFLLFGFFNNAHAALSDNLVGYWNLNEASGTRADSIGSNTLSDNGSVGSTTGKVNNAASFSGSNYLSIPDNAAVSTGDTVIETQPSWMKVKFEKGEGWVYRNYVK